MRTLDELDRLRIAAMRGAVTAADEAEQAVAELERMRTPSRQLRAGRLLALEARGHAIRHSIDRLLVVRACPDRGDDGVDGHFAALRNWKRSCDDLSEEFVAAKDEPLLAAILHMRSTLLLQEVLSYSTLAPADSTLCARIPLLALEGLARAKRAEELFAIHGAHAMRIKAMTLEVEWQWLRGDHCQAVAAANRLLHDANSIVDLGARAVAASVVEGRSPYPWSIFVERLDV